MKVFSLNYRSLSFCIGLFLGFLSLYFFLPEKNNEIKYDELALGKENKTVMAIVEGKKVHCSGIFDYNSCLEDYETNINKLPVLLWLGNSQLHAINQYNDGDETAAAKLHRKLKNDNIYALTFSQANASLQEHYLLLAYLLDQFPIKSLILPVVFDDMREDEIRPDNKKILKNQSTLKKIRKSLTGRRIIDRLNQTDLAGNKSEISNYKTEKEFENLLDRKLNEIWPIWSKREILRNKLFSKLYTFRNSILGINASSTRKMIKGRYIKNIDAYKDIINLALENKLKVLVYIAPIRNDIKIPYDLNEYNIFKKEIENIAKKNKINFVSFENVVPPEFWGNKSSTNFQKKKEVDFMHFQSKGHSFLADYVYLELSKLKIK